MAYNGPLPQVVNAGGTGATTLTGVLIGNGTSAVTASTITQYGTVIAGASNAVTSVAPSATSGVPLISQGAAANPAYGTAVVAGGGSGATSFNINGPVISGTSTTAALAAVTLASQKFLVGNAGAPTAKGLSVVRQVFSSTGTYTPTAGMIYCDIIAIGGGGGGGGAGSTSATQYSWGDGAGAGEYAVGTFSAATLGASQAVTIGALGSAGSSAGGAGGNGGNTSVGALISANGGTGGQSNASTTTPGTGGIAAGGTGGTGGDYRTPGAPGFYGIAYPTGLTAILNGGMGASSLLGAGGIAGHNAAGSAGLGSGSGGGGASQAASQAGAAGGSGTKGIVIVTEYVIA
jgi:hypothetical protein